MLRDLTRAKILLILGFFVAIFAICYHSYNGDSPHQSASEKTNRDRGSDPAMDSHGAEMNVEQNDAEGDASTEQYSKDDDTTRTNRIAIYKEIISIMIPLIKSLGLENKTEEEKKEALANIDFSSLDTHALPQDPKMNAKVLLNILGIALGLRSIHGPAEKLHPFDRKKYDLRKFNSGIVGLGVDNFMTAATKFCEEEAAAAAGEIPIVSIGSGDGTVEKEIIKQYRERYGGREDISIQLVDPDPKFDGIVDFKTVDHLIRESPGVVGNCVALIIWPDDMLEDAEDYYDIEAVRKLQPKSVLVVYESTGGSGSNDFRNFLHEDSLDELSPEEFGSRNWMSQYLFKNKKKTSYGLENYSVVELARQKITSPRAGTFIFRIVKMIRTN